MRSRYPSKDSEKPSNENKKEKDKGLFIRNLKENKNYNSKEEDLQEEDQ